MKSYTIRIKKFDLPSSYGIGGGRISKLDIRTDDGQVVARYDRGWDIEPQDEDVKELLSRIIQEEN